MNNREKILIAASQLDVTFSESDLVVRSWELFPKTFGLEGYENLYPDSKYPLTYVMGKRGTVATGLMSRVSPKMYAMTLSGKRRVLAITGEVKSEPTAKLATKEQSNFLRQTIDSVAYVKFMDGRKGVISFVDACWFWGEGDSPDPLKVDLIIDKLRQLESDTIHGDLQIATGRIVTAGDMRNLIHFHWWLMDRYERHLKVLRARIAS